MKSLDLPASRPDRAGRVPHPCERPGKERRSAPENSKLQGPAVRRVERAGQDMGEKRVGRPSAGAKGPRKNVPQTKTRAETPGGFGFARAHVGRCETHAFPPEVPVTFVTDAEVEEIRQHPRRRIAARRKTVLRDTMDEGVGREHGGSRNGDIAREVREALEQPSPTKAQGTGELPFAWDPHARQEAVDVHVLARTPLERRELVFTRRPALVRAEAPLPEGLGNHAEVSLVHEKVHVAGRPRMKLSTSREMKRHSLQDNKRHSRLRSAGSRFPAHLQETLVVESGNALGRDQGARSMRAGLRFEARPRGPRRDTGRQVEAPCERGPLLGDRRERSRVQGAESPEQDPGYLFGNNDFRRTEPKPSRHVCLRHRPSLSLRILAPSRAWGRGLPAALGKCAMRGMVPKLKVAAAALLLVLVSPASGRAGSTLTTAPYTPNGNQSGTANGDYVSEDAAGGGLNLPYHFWVEVPPGLGRLVVDIWDADIGAGGAGEAAAGRDRARSVFDVNAVYTLLDPTGATRATVNGTNALPALADNAWFNLFNSVVGLTAGHWEVRIDQSTLVDVAGNRDAINAFGVRAHDGTAGAGGTELNVYYDSITDVGVNPPAVAGLINTRTYVEYPYIVSGCSFFENDFDFDTNNATGQSIVYASRTPATSAAFSQTLANATLSVNDVWNRDAIAGWTSDSRSTEYGIWSQTTTMRSYVVGGANNGNYGNLYVANFQAVAGAPIANPPANSFRTYIATDAGGAPVKPYLEQFLGYLSGPRTPTVGQTTVFTVTVRVVNPTLLPIAFGAPAADIVTANVLRPVGSLGYQGGAQVTQGTILSEPAIGGTGNVTWNPGPVAAGATAFLAFNVAVTPTMAGQRIPVTNTPVSGNGTRATFVDETGNTTQARATFTLGPVCDLAVNLALATPAVVSSLRAHDGPRGVEVEWETASEVGTAGFDLLRWDPETDGYVTLNKGLLPGLQGSPQGGRYRFVDEGASASAKLWYVLSEATASGERRFHGPYEVQVETASPSASLRSHSADGYDRTARRRPASQRAARVASALTTLPLAAPVAGATAVKIGVEKDGLYYVSATSIAAALGWPAAQVGAFLSTQRFALSSQGRPVAWTPSSGGLLFYGRGVDSIYTRDNVYWLGVGHGTMMTTADGRRPSPTGPASFLDQVHAEENRLPATAVSTDPESDYWYWDYLSGGHPTYGSRSFPLAAVAVDHGGAPARLTIHLHGATTTAVTGEHHVVARLNGSPIGEVQWEGVVPATIDVPVGASMVQEGQNSVELDALLDTAAPYSIVYLDSFDLTYPRLYQAAGSALSFRGDGHGVVTVAGFPDPAIGVFDVTDPANTHRVARTTVTGAPGAFQVSLVPAGPDTRYVASTPAGWLAPKWIRSYRSAGLKSRRGGADYIVLTTSDLMAPARRLAAMRQRQGLVTAVVDVADVMDEFDAGISTPHAVQAFLRWAAAHWSPAPRSLLLAGLGTLDYKDYLGNGGNLLPPLMVSTPFGLFASDNDLVDLDGDGLPDLAVGRVPAVTAAELDAYVSKIAAYEASDGADWKGRAVWASDKVDPGADFPADAERLVSGLPTGYSADRVYLAPGTITASRAQLLGDLQSGAGIMNYVGHGGIDRLAAEGLLVSTDASSLTNAERLPLLTALTCTINRFEVPGYASLGGELVKSPSGGFSAVWAPTGLSLNAEANALGARFYATLAGKPGSRVGDLVNDTLRAYAASGDEPSLVSVYNLLGDPALVMKPPASPASPPPSGERSQGSLRRTE